MSTPEDRDDKVEEREGETPPVEPDNDRADSMDWSPFFPRRRVNSDEMAASAEEILVGRPMRFVFKGSEKGYGVFTVLPPRWEE